MRLAADPGETLVKRKKPKYLTLAKIRKLQRLQRKAYTFTEIAEMTGIDRHEVINVLYPTT